MKELTDCKTWATFRQNIIVEFEKLIVSGTRPKLGEEGYVGAYNIMVVDNDGESLAYSIVHYDERATAAKSEVSDLEIRLS